jgi:hypothetical protein
MRRRNGRLAKYLRTVRPRPATSIQPLLYITKI